MLELNPPSRLLLGPGPSNVSYRVLKAMSNPPLGHLDPAFIEIMDETCRLLRFVFQTRNELTFPVSGTGSAGLEAVLVNLLEPGDTAIICVNGFFGERLVEVAGRCGAQVVRVDEQWGKPMPVDKALAALEQHPRAKLLAMVHAETSTGVENPVQELGAQLKDRPTLFVVDAVTSLGAVELKVDQWGIDAAYSCSQKGLAVPPGMAPVTFGAKAVYALKKRKSKVSCWYLDAGLLSEYWGGQTRKYHHTCSSTMVYGLCEGLRIIEEEGLEPRFQRHRRVAAFLHQELAALGFGFFAQEGCRLPTLTTVFPPDQERTEQMRIRLLKEHDIEVGGGLGPVAGKIWRIGTMGENARERNVAVLIDAIKRVM